jgi:hypothetical protein
MKYGFRIAAYVRDDHWQPGSHAFEDDIGEALLMRGKKTEISCR